MPRFSIPCPGYSAGCAEAAHSRCAASCNGLLPSGIRSAVICQKNTPRQCLTHRPLGFDSYRLAVVVADDF